MDRIYRKALGEAVINLVGSLLDFNSVSHLKAKPFGVLQSPKSSSQASLQAGHRLVVIQKRGAECSPVGHVNQYFSIRD